MRVTIAVLIFVLVLDLVAWRQFSSPGSDPTIRVVTDWVKRDTSEIVE